MMITRSFMAIANATRQLFQNWQAPAIMMAIYVLLLTSLYIFVTTKEATPAQIVVSITLTLVVPLLFFMLQAISASYARQRSPRSLFENAVRDCWKLFLVSLPVIAIAVLSGYLLNKFQAYLASSAGNPLSPEWLTGWVQGQGSNASIRWSGVAFSSIRYFVFGVIAPLALIHLWIAAAHDGLNATLRTVVTRLARALAAPSVLIYMAGFVVFALVPYLVLFKATTTTGAWREIALLAVRLTTVVCFTLFGWVITIGALSSAMESASARATEDA